MDVRWYEVTHFVAWESGEAYSDEKHCFGGTYLAQSSQGS